MFGLIFLLFALWRIGDLVIAYIAQQFDRYNEQFIYKFQLYHYNPFIPKFLISFANYDGAHYLHIAHDGYHQFEQSFFPLFPLLIHLFSPVFSDQYFLTGFFFANISFLCGLYFFKKYLELNGFKSHTIIWIFLTLLTFPTSFFFGAVYTEGLFFLLITSSFYFVQKRQYTPLVIVSILAALTRLVGVFLIIPIFTTILLEQQKLKIQENEWRGKVKEILKDLSKHRELIAISLSPLIGILIYIVYLSFSVHDPFSFYNSLNAFNTGRTTKHIIFLPQVYYRYIHIFLTVPHTVTYFIAIVEFLTFNLFLFVLLYDLWRLWKQRNINSRISLIGLNLFSLANLLLPTFTGTLTSLPRYSLLSLSFFIRIAQIRNTFIRVLILLIFIILHIILITFFIQEYFVS